MYMYVHTMASNCGCKGIRSCLVCEPDTLRKCTTVKNVPDKDVYMCYNCGNVINTSDSELSLSRPPLRRCAENDCKLADCLYSPDHVTTSDPHEQCIQFNGITVVKDFITPMLENDLIREIDSSEWAESQSGRRKQDYGPKVNFKKAKVKLGHFNGLPSYSRKLVTKLSAIPALIDFIPIELCNLDYNPSRGSAIDPHRDDSWVWGDRLVTLNLLSNTFLSFTRPELSVTINVPLPRLSLVVVMGVARNEWNHSIKRENVINRRVAMTMRELGEDFTEGHKDEVIGKELLRIATVFWSTF